ncbi:hypothetical protein MNBD_UNCLBAC01-1041, partial [hydrothermal vent metagenome]
MNIQSIVKKIKKESQDEQKHIATRI